MAKTRRVGVEDSKQRIVLMDAVEQILRHDGYVGLSAQKVANFAGLTKQLLYYYYKTMDELLLALVRRVNERRLVRFELALASPEPLRALWALNSDPSGAGLATELTAIASHREAIRAEIIGSARRFRTLQVSAVAELLAKAGKADAPASGIVMIASAIARTISSEAALGMNDGHEEALVIVEFMLQALGSPPQTTAV